MTNMREQDRREQREVLRRPGVSLEFFGWSHYPLDLQVIPQLRTTLQEFIAQSRGRPVIIYHETVDATPEINSKVKEVASQVGYQGALLFPTMLLFENRERVPSVQEIEERKKRIASSPLPVILADRLLPFGDISYYFIYGVIDDILLQNRHVRVDNETHTERVKRILSDAETRRRELTRQLKWGTRDLESALAMYLSAQNIYIEEMEAPRKPDIVNDLASKVQQLRQRGGSLFLLFGSTHEDLPEDVQKKIDPQHRFVSIKTRIHTPNNYYDNLVAAAMRRGDKPSDEMLARAFFTIECFRALDELFQRGVGDLQGYAENWQTIEASVEDVASSLSFEDIRRLNDTGEPVLKVFFGHPAARVVLPFLH